MKLVFLICSLITFTAVYPLSSFAAPEISSSDTSRVGITSPNTANQTSQTGSCVKSGTGKNVTCKGTGSCEKTCFKDAVLDNDTIIGYKCTCTSNSKNECVLVRKVGIDPNKFEWQCLAGGSSCPESKACKLTEVSYEGITLHKCACETKPETDTTDSQVAPNKF